MGSLLLLGAGRRGAAASTLLNDLVAYWRLDEESGTRADQVGSYDLTDNNTVGFDTGKQGNAASFVAANSESLSHADGSGGALDLLLNGTNPFSISYWLKHADGSSASEAVIGRNSAGGIGTLVYVTTSAHVLQIVRAGGGDAIVASHSRTLGTDWAHFVWTYDGSRDGANGLALYVNGSSVSLSFTFDGLTAAVGAQAVPLRLGGSDQAGIFLDGAIDEAGLWSRELTTDEITELYAGGDGVQVL